MLQQTWAVACNNNTHDLLDLWLCILRILQGAALCRYLQGLLNSNCPALDLTAFTAVANAAADVGSSQQYNIVQPDFTVAASPMNIFLAGFFLEDVAVGMYQDLIPNIVSRDLLVAATGKQFANIFFLPEGLPCIVSGLIC